MLVPRARDEPVASRYRTKSPKAASNLPFERPWDHFVPAKSTGKLALPPWLSKKFPHWEGRRAAPSRHRSAMSLSTSADSAARRLLLAAGEESPDNGNNEDQTERNTDVQRRDEPGFFLRRRGRR